MSKVADIKAAINALVSAALTDYYQLPDNLATSENSNLHLEKGFAVAYGPAENNTQNFCQGELLITRQYDVHLTNIYVPSHDETHRDLLEAAIMESAFTILEDLQADVQLGGLAIDTSPTGDTGIQYLVDNESQEQMITVTIGLSILYSETIST